MFNELLILSRALNLIYHHMHNVASGHSFFADHAELALMYAAVDADYDSVAERRIGLGNAFSASDAANVVAEAAELLKALPEAETITIATQEISTPSINAMFSFAMQLESEYVRELKSAESGMSAGTINMLQGLADLSEVRQYKIGQRLK